MVKLLEIKRPICRHMHEMHNIRMNSNNIGYILFRFILKLLYMRSMSRLLYCDSKRSMK